LEVRTSISRPPPEQARKLVDELYAAWSLHEADRVDAIFTEDAVYEDVAGGQIRRGRGEIKEMLRAACVVLVDPFTVPKGRSVPFNMR
jgi:uncharacterized protein (TIGR02246 family)